jgi:membrane protein implicated in regulation of membrane protease activity
VDLEAPETWQILWVAATGVFLVAEMARRLRLWFLPLAIGSGAAAIAAFAGAPPVVQGVLFAGVSSLALVALRPVSRALLLSSPPSTVGSGRWVGRQGRVVADVRAGSSGWVVIGRERWRAECGFDVDIPTGATVLVTGVEGTHLVVLPLEFPQLPNQSTGHEPEGV